MIIAIDTSTAQASVALADETQTLAEWSWMAGRAHSQTLNRALTELFAASGTSMNMLAAVVVASGPGSFNGVRVAISAGKGLAMARQIPLIGICTLDVIGFQAMQPGATVCATLSAGRGQWFEATYNESSGVWRPSGRYRVATPEAIAKDLPEPVYLAGEGANDISLACSAIHKSCAVESAARRLRRAGYLAELGRRYLDAGGEDQLDNLEPMYLRLSAAEETRQASSQL